MATKALNSDLAKEERTSFKHLLSKIPEYQRQFFDKKGVISIIRTARANDIGKIVKLAHDIWIEEPYNNDLSDSEIRRGIESVLEKVNPIMLVVEQNDKIVGFIWGYDLYENKYPVLANYLKNSNHSHIGYIAEMAVSNRLRRHEIAGELLDSYKELAKQKRIDDIVLDTKNPEAIELYKKMHYKRIIDPVSNQEVVDQAEDGIYHFFHLEVKL
ncbi:MAG: GNAT family N-acetyltransferase [Candidatus Micrarchaeaceae archaeon]|jgi:ribosomal protein S18 acetylase RimI-like enzyme